MFQLNNFTILKSILFCVGLCLTLWRGHDCLQKLSNESLSTKVNMVRNYDTIQPAITLCPNYHGAYELRKVSFIFSTNCILSFDIFSVLNSIGIEDMNAYRNGEWFGNSSLDGAAIFKIVTFNLSDLIDSFKFKMVDGEMLSFAKLTTSFESALCFVRNVVICV